MGGCEAIGRCCSEKCEQCPFKVWQTTTSTSPLSIASSSKTKPSSSSTSTYRSSKKQPPNKFCDILKLEGTVVNNESSLALEKFAVDSFNKHFTAVS